MLNNEATFMHIFSHEDFIKCYENDKIRKQYQKKKKNREDKWQAKKQASCMKIILKGEKKFSMKNIS